jgi:acetyltransferase-like isoleucine patch superfamily enzyme
MIRKVLNKFISKTKGEKYELDSDIPTSYLFSVACLKVEELWRGFWIRIHFKKGHCGKRIFIGKHVTIKCKKKISCGRGVSVGQGSYIDALSKEGIIIGDNVSFGRNCQIECTGVLRELGEGLIIKDGVGIASNAFIAVRGKVSIGKNTILGPNVKIFSENHNYSSINIPIRLQGDNRKGVIIGDDCWIGSNAIILDGVIIGNGSVVAAGAVVTKSIDNCSVVAGVPARLIKIRGQNQ